LQLLTLKKIANISKINAEREINEKEAERKKQLIGNEIMIHRKKAETDALYYRMVKEAEANQFKYTPEYLKYVLYSSLENNTKIFYGTKLPDLFKDFLNNDFEITK